MSGGWMPNPRGEKEKGKERPAHVDGRGDHHSERSASSMCREEKKRGKAISRAAATRIPLFLEEREREEAS